MNVAMGSHSAPEVDVPAPEVVPSQAPEYFHGSPAHAYAPEQFSSNGGLTYNYKSPQTSGLAALQEKGNGRSDPQERRVLGCTPKWLWIMILLIVVVMAGAIGGGLGGALSTQSKS